MQRYPGTVRSYEALRVAVMNIEVQTANRTASTCSLACVVAASEVEPLLERCRSRERYAIATLYGEEEPTSPIAPIPTTPEQ